MNFATYVPPVGRCSGGAGRGTITFASYMEYMEEEQSSMGMYVCRTIAGRALLSGHAKGRAYDEGLLQINGQANPLGLAIIERVCRYGRELGIDHAIFNLGGTGRGRPWIWKQTHPTGVPYLGVHPHKDHIHWGLTEGASRNLTWGTLDHYLGAEMTNAEWERMEDLVRATVDERLKVYLMDGTKKVLVDPLGSAEGPTPREAAFATYRAITDEFTSGEATGLDPRQVAARTLEKVTTE